MVHHVGDHSTSLEERTTNSSRDDSTIRLIKEDASVRF